MFACVFFFFSMGFEVKVCVDLAVFEEGSRPGICLSDGCLETLLMT